MTLRRARPLRRTESGSFFACASCGAPLMLVEEPADIYEKAIWFNVVGRFEMWCYRHGPHADPRVPGSGRTQAHRLPAGILCRSIPRRNDALIR